MVSTCPLIFKYSSPFTKSTRSILSAPITIGITIISLFAFFQFYCGLPGRKKSTIQQVRFFKLTITKFGRLAEIGDLCLSQNPRELCAFVEHIPFVRMVNFNFLAQFSADHLPQPVIIIIIWIRRGPSLMTKPLSWYS